MNEFPENRAVSGPAPIRNLLTDQERIKDVGRTQQITFVPPLRATETPGFGTTVTIDPPAPPRAASPRTWHP